MKTLFILLIFFTCTIAHSDESANPACGMMICLSTDNLKRGGLPCVMMVKEWKKIKKYHSVAGVRVLDVPRSLKYRRDRLNSCRGGRRIDVEMIMAQYGMLF